MQICKKITLAAVCTVLSLQGVLTAQQVTMPAMPEMPVMPEIPKTGETFYKPSIPGKSAAPKKEKEEKSDTSAKETVMSNGQTTQEYLAEMMTKNNLLSAQDISNLYDSGSFSTLSSLLSGQSVAQSSSSSTDALLRQMLVSLEDLKKNQNNSSEAEKQKLAEQQKDSQIFRTREPSVLRFRINGYDVADSLTKVFFSEPEADGSFLFTADRKYFVSKRPRTESFYILFKSIKSNGATTTYQVEPTVSQDERNENSFIYRLSLQKDLTAEKTGNLVVIHCNKNDFNMDLLLDIDCSR